MVMQAKQVTLKPYNSVEITMFYSKIIINFI